MSYTTEKILNTLSATSQNFFLKSVFNEHNGIHKINILSSDQYFRKTPRSMEITEYATYSIDK